MEKTLLGALAKVLNKSQKELTETLKSEDGELKENAESLILDAVTAHIGKIKSETVDSTLKRARREERTLFEKEIAEANEFDNSEKLQGVDLVTKILEAKVTEATKDVKKPKTEDDVKIHPVYRELEKRYQADLAKKEAEMQDALQAKEAEFEKKETWHTVKKLAEARLKERNPLLYQDPAKAQRQVDKLLFEEIKSLNYKVDNGEVLVLDAEGKRIEDNLGHAIDFHKYVDKVLDSNFEFPAAEQRQNGGNKNQDGQKPTTKPQTTAEYNSYISDKSIPLAERDSVMEAKRKGELVLKD